MHDRQCTATTKRGNRCKARALPAKTLCWSHDPDKRAQWEAWRRQGGKAKSNQARAAKQLAAAGREIDQDDLPALIRATIIDVRSGMIEPAVATAMANLAKAAMQLESSHDLMRRVEALEELLGRNHGQMRRIG